MNLCYKYTKAVFDLANHIYAELTWRGKRRKDSNQSLVKKIQAHIGTCSSVWVMELGPCPRCHVPLSQRKDTGPGGHRHVHIKRNSTSFGDLDWWGASPIMVWCSHGNTLPTS